MRELCLEELELIAGTFDTTQRVPVTGHYPSYSPSTYFPPPSGGGGGGGDTPSCQTAQAPADRVDQSVLKSPTHEGNSNPANHPTNNSGLTIGYGVDLKSKSAEWLSSSGITPSLYNQLAPYAGLSGSIVDQMLASGSPITASNSDIDLLYNKAYAENYAQATNLYNQAEAANSLNLSFTQLPAALQTVIMDVGYQTPQISAYPNFFQDITNGQWDAAATELQNFYGAGSTTARFLDDAALIRAAISSGTIPPSTTGPCQ